MGTFQYCKYSEVVKRAGLKSLNNLFEDIKDLYENTSPLGSWVRVPLLAIFLPFLSLLLGTLAILTTQGAVNLKGHSPRDSI
jgi:hypothetical protein